MRYLSDNHDVVINTFGHCRALEKLGFVSEFQIEYRRRKEERLERLQMWISENKERLIEMNKWRG